MNFNKIYEIQRERVYPVKSAKGGAEQFNGVNPVEFAECSEAIIPLGRVDPIRNKTSNRTSSHFQKFTKTAGLAAVFAVVGLFLFAGSAKAESQISLTTNALDYTIENEYYKAIIPTDTGTSKGKGLIRYLYIKKSDSNWSSNLILENTIMDWDF
jgi:hypothetical protein